MNWNEDINAEIQKELDKNTLADKAWGVKIVLHHSTGHCAQRDTVYYNKGFRFQCFMKWKWYFRYRAALFQVQNPKWCVELVTFDYEMKSTNMQIEKRRKDIIAARRRKLTIAKNRLAEYKNTYKGLFPLSEDPDYIKSLQIVTNYEARLNEAEDENFSPHIVHF